MEVDTEFWRPAPRHGGYEISDWGRVRSLWKPGSPRLLKPTPSTNEYLRIRLGRGRLFYVHKLKPS